MRKHILAVAALATLPSFGAQAATVFTDRDGFVAAVGSVEVETFDEAIPQDNTITFDDGTTSTRLVDNFNRNLVRSGQFAGTVQNNGRQTITFDFDRAVTGFGADFFSLGELAFGAEPSLFVSGRFDGMEETISISDAIGESGFFGLSSDSAFGSVTFSTATTGFTGFENFELDDLTLTVAAVPVPAALPLLAAGLGVFGFVARRRRSARAA